MIIHYLATANIPSKTANSLQIIKMCDAFVSLGHNVKLIIPNLINKGEKITNYYDLKNHIEIIRVWSKSKYIFGFYNFLIPLFLVLRSFKEDKSPFIITRSLVVSFFLILFKKKHILEIHDDLSIFGSKFSRLYHRLNFLNSSYIIKLIFITASLKKYISKKYNYKKKNFLVLPSATDIKNLNKISNKKCFNIGYFGSIYQSRGINTIIDLAKRDKSNSYFVYGGNKKDFDKIRYKLNSRNLHFYKQLPFKKIKKIMTKIDVLLMPYTNLVTVSGNVGNIYNFMSPMKMFDYLGSGKIIISSNIPVLNEILKDKKNSILIKNYLNVQSWLFEINKLKFNKSKNYLLCKNAFNTGTKHTWKKRAKKILN